MATCVVFDCESDGLPTRSYDGRGRQVQEFHERECTCACALVLDVARLPDVEHGRMLTCWRHKAPAKGVSPFRGLLYEFDRASLIVAYNAFDFDFPLLRKYYNGNGGDTRYNAHRAKCHDVFTRVRGATALWPKLDALLTLNDLPAKTSSGAEAVRMWHDGRLAELEQYCADDVRLTARLALLPELKWSGVPALPESVFGILPALRAQGVVE